MSRRPISTALRLYALGARFVLIFFLAIFLVPSDVGLYGLVAATASYAVYILGLDLYTHTTRDIIRTDPDSWRTKILSHGTALALVAAVVVPLFAILFVAGVLPWSVVIWFPLITLTEHWGTELDRLLVAMSKQFAASVVIIVRQAALPTLVIPLFALVPTTRDVSVVFGAWVGLNTVAIILGVLYIFRATVPQKPFRVQWSWLGRGVIVAFPFLVGTLCLRVIFTFDRQIVAVLSGLEVLGAYTLAVTVAGGLNNLIAVGVHQFTYPALVKSAGQGDERAFLVSMRSIGAQTLAIVVGVTAIVTMLYPWIVSWLDEPVYSQYSWAIPIATAIFGIYNMSLVPHLGLYALNADRAILLATVLATVGFFSTVAILLYAGHDAAVAALSGIGLSSLMLLTVKYTWYRVVSRRSATWSTPD